MRNKVLSQQLISLMIFTDFQGNNWNFYGTEDWRENDGIAAIMNTQGTDLIYDDVIISVTYQGYATN